MPSGGRKCTRPPRIPLPCLAWSIKEEKVVMVTLDYEEHQALAQQKILVRLQQVGSSLIAVLNSCPGVGHQVSAGSVAEKFPVILLLSLIFKGISGFLFFLTG